MQANSRRVTSNQQGIHQQLTSTVNKYLRSEFKRPFAEHTLTAFSQAEHFKESISKPLILDACCGTAQSTVNIAQQHPEHCVIGIDKSLHRLSKQQDLPANAIILQADLIDFYRLAEKAQWKLDKHYLLYPNPWPKASQLKRRWHAMPSFPAMLKLGGIIDVRSNWKTYIDEFVAALQIAGIETVTEAFKSSQPITAFEKKYIASKHELWRCTADLSLLQNSKISVTRTEHS